MATARKSFEIDMCSGPILPKMLRFALPLMFSSLLQLLFNAADIIVVGRFAGDNSMAAVGSTAYLINLFVNLFIGISVGANLLASRLYGAQDKDGLHQTVHTAMLFSLISGIFLAIFGFISAKQLLTLMHSPAEVIDLATLYLRIYFLGMPAAMLYNFGAALLRAVGDTKRALYYLLFAGVVNVLLNLVLVVVFKMDVAGVAIATMLLVRLLSSAAILYGRRRFIVCVLIAFALQWTAVSALMGSELGAGRVEVVGYIIPGLLANEMERQGAGRTLLALLLLSAAVRLTLMAMEALL